MEVLTVAGSVTLTACIVSFAVFVVARGLSAPLTPALAFGIALVPLFCWSVRAPALGPRVRIYVPLAVAALAPLIALGAAAVLSQPLVNADHVGTNDLLVASPALLVTAPVVLFVVGTPTLALLWPLVGRDERLAFDRGLRGVAAFSIASALLLTVAAMLASRHRSEPARWKENLPIVAEVGPQQLVEIPIETLVLEQPGVERAMRAVTPHGELLFACSTVALCTLSFRAPGLAQPSRALPWSNEVSTFRIRLDDRHGIYIVEDAWTAVAFARSGEALSAVTVDRVRDVLAPPHAWTFGAALGVSCAAALFAFARHRRGLRDAIVWSEGTVGDDGAIALPDGSRLAVPHLAVGTKIVAAGIDAALPTFRTNPVAAARTIEVGTLEDRRREARTEQTAYASWSLAMIALTIAPLLTTLFAGLLP